MAGFRVATIVSPLVLAGTLVGLSRFDQATRLAPVLGLVRGPTGWVLLALAVGVASTRALGSRLPTHVPPLRPLALFVLGAVLMTGLGLAYTNRLRVSGDEPHYLLMAQSLWRDGDLDLRNNFGAEDYREYTPGPVRPHYGAPRRDGRPFPAHGPGLPVLLAPVYALGGRAGCVVFLAICGAAVAARTSVLARRLGGTAEVAWWAWAAAVGPPLLFYSFHVYTEVPSALASLVALELLLVPVPTVATALLTTLATSLLPWLHVKMLLVSAALGLVGLVRLRGRPLKAMAILSVILAAAHGLYFQIVFGSPTPLAVYGGVPADVSAAPGRALVGLWVDRSFGLLPHAPLFVLALPGLWLLAAKGRATWPLLLVAAATLAPVLAWRMWWGGQCPPGRFLVPLVPTLAVAAGLVAGGPRRGLVRWRAPLAALGLGLALYMAADPGALLLLNRANRPTRVWAALSGEVALGRYLPSLTLADPVEARVAALWLAALGVLLTLHVLAQSRDGVDRLFRGLSLPAAMLLAIGLAVDGWARPGPPEPASPVGPPAVIEDPSS
jgi:hypothetical protein